MASNQHKAHLSHVRAELGQIDPFGVINLRDTWTTDFMFYLIESATCECLPMTMTMMMMVVMMVMMVMMMVMTMVMMMVMLRRRMRDAH